jgi:hypothetical protein
MAGMEQHRTTGIHLGGSLLAAGDFRRGAEHLRHQVVARDLAGGRRLNGQAEASRNRANAFFPLPDKGLLYAERYGRGLRAAQNLYSTTNLLGVSLLAHGRSLATLDIPRNSVANGNAALVAIALLT